MNELELVHFALNDPKCSPCYQLSLIIRENRKRLDYSEDEMAEVVKCDRGTYCDLENGEKLTLALYNEVIRLQEIEMA